MLHVEGLKVLKCAKRWKTMGFTKKITPGLDFDGASCRSTKALHLHQLRKPAIDHFQKLIALSGKASDKVFLGASDKMNQNDRITDFIQFVWSQ